MENKNAYINRIQNVLIIVLSVLLIISLSLGASFAWFRDQESQKHTISIGGAVNIALLDVDENTADTQKLIIVGALNKPITPGSQLKLNAKAQLAKSSTPAIVRFSVDLNITGYSLTAYNDTLKAEETLTEEEMQEKILLIKTDILTKIADTLNSATNQTHKWRLHNGYLYYVGDNSNPSTTDSDQYLLKAIDSASSTTTISIFNDTMIKLPGSSIDNHFQNSTLSITLNIQALQSVIYNEEGSLISLTTGNVESYFELAFAD